MARTLAEIRASRPEVERAKIRAKIRATTEAAIARQAAEDDSAPAAPLSEFVKRRPGQRGPGLKPAKVQIALRIDPETLDAYKAGGAGWQTRMNEALKAAVARRR